MIFESSEYENNPEAQTQLSEILKSYPQLHACVALKYYEGFGTDEPDFQKAAQHFVEVAEVGNAKEKVQALIHLCNIYRWGGNHTKPQSKLFLQTAEKLYQCAHPLGATYLGAIYTLGFGVDQDLHKARSYFDDAFDKFSFPEEEYDATIDMIEANFLRALCYSRVADAPKKQWAIDYSRAVLYFQSVDQAIEILEKQGRNLPSFIIDYHRYTCLHLGKLYELGIGVKVDDTQAFAYFAKSAKTGHAESLYALGVLYTHKKNATTENKQLAREYFLQAANWRHLPAVIMLIKDYFKSKNFEEVMPWSDFLTSHGNRIAKGMLSIGTLDENILSTSLQQIEDIILPVTANIPG